eukprot:scaffold3074_cov108-Cylindrotheca_fusiformis.AAC.5
MKSIQFVSARSPLETSIDSIISERANLLVELAFCDCASLWTIDVSCPVNVLGQPGLLEMIEKYLLRVITKTNRHLQ